MARSRSDFANYYCKSLEDSSFVQGALEKSDLLPWERLPHKDLLHGRVQSSLLQHFWQKSINNIDAVKVFLRPIVFELSDSFKSVSNIHYPHVLSPIITLAALKKNGRLYPVQSFIARDIFTPTANSVITIGAIKELDLYLKVCEHNPCCTLSSKYQPAQQTPYIEQWRAYIKDCEQALNAICQNWSKDPSPYIKSTCALICAKNDIRCDHEPIKDLYRQLSQSTRIDTPLFDNFISTLSFTKRECLSIHANFTKRLVSTEKKLLYTPSQRNAVAHIVEQANGEILAINTPPETGKTTLIKAAIANQWALAAVSQTAPPISIILSNNQSSLEEISNLFGQNLLLSSDIFETRWLPDLQKNVLKSKTPIQNTFDPQYAELSDSIFSHYETPEYYQQAKEHYLINTQLHYPQFNLSKIEAITHFLHNKIQEKIQHLTALENAWKKITHTHQALDHMLESSSQVLIEEAQKRAEILSQEMQELVDFSSRWVEYDNEHHMFSSLLTLVPHYAEKQVKQALDFLKTIMPSHVILPTCKSISDIRQAIKSLLESKNEALINTQAESQYLQQLINNEKVHSIDWAEAVIDLIATSDYNEIHTLADAENAVDQTLRFEIFQLVVHYWEGRWLLEMEKFLAYPDAYLNPKNPLALLQKWRLRMMLTPAMGTSYQQLPRLFQTAEKNRATYLFNSIDLLVIDQAEQTSPEISASAFSLAKKALVFGDTTQAEHYPLISRYIDIFNLQDCQLISSKNPENSFLKLSNLGKTISLGNVMRIAQKRTPYHEVTQLSSGLFLKEQMSSYNELVQLSNTLSYKGALIPTRGRKIDVAIKQKKILEDLSPVSYVHVDGFMRKTKYNDYNNLNEAQTIAYWLKGKKEELERFYKKPLSQIISIATPYHSQVTAILFALQECGLNTEEYRNNHIHVCTSYAKEIKSFPIVLFSNVYSKHIFPVPINKDHKLFNSIISHACDAFVIFADVDTLSNAFPASPRKILAQTLLSSDQHKVECPHQPRSDLLALKNTSRQKLETLQDHQTFFKTLLLSEKIEEMHIACPAMGLYETSEFMMAYFETAIQQGASIHIYTDFPCENNQPFIESPKLEELILRFKNINIPIHIISKVNSNILICNRDTFCIGLFQWLNENNPFTTERPSYSIAYKGNALLNEIEIQKKFLMTKIISSKESVRMITL